MNKEVRQTKGEQEWPPRGRRERLVCSGIVFEAFRTASQEATNAVLGTFTLFLIDFIIPSGCCRCEVLAAARLASRGWGASARPRPGWRASQGRRGTGRPPRIPRGVHGGVGTTRRSGRWAFKCRQDSREEKPGVLDMLEHVHW